MSGDIDFIFTMPDGSEKIVETDLGSHKAYQKLDPDEPDKDAKLGEDYSQEEKDCIDNLFKYLKECVSFRCQCIYCEPNRWIDNYFERDFPKYHKYIVSNRGDRSWWLGWFISTGYENILECDGDWVKFDIGLMDVGWSMSDEIGGSQYMEIKKELDSYDDEDEWGYSEYHKLYYKA